MRARGISLHPILIAGLAACLQSTTPWAIASSKDGPLTCIKFGLNAVLESTNSAGKADPIGELLEEMRLSGTGVSHEEEAHIRAAFKLMPLLDRQTFHRAVAEELYFRGMNTANKARLAVRGMSLLGPAEREGITGNIYLRLKELAGVNLKLDDLSGLEKIAKQENMTVTEYIAAVKEAREILTADPLEAKAAIYLMLDQGSDKLAEIVASQFASKGEFGKSIVAMPESVALTVQGASDGKRSVSIVTGVFQRKRLTINEGLLRLDEHPIFWRPWDSWERFAARAFGREKKATFDDLQYILAHPPHRSNLLFRTLATALDFGESNSKAEQMGRVASFLEKLVRRGELKEPLRAEQVQYVIKHFRYEESQELFLKALHETYPGNSLYLPEMLPAYRSGKFGLPK